MYITSINNEYIKEISKLNEKKYRDKLNKYLIEGLHLVTEALKYDIIDTIIIREDFSYETNIKHIIVSNEVMKKLSDNPSIPKIMAVVNKKESTIKGNKILLLDRLQDPGNLGTILRTADSANLKQIILSSDSADPYNPKVVRSTMGAIFRMNIITTDNLAKTLQMIKKHKFEVVATSLDTDKSVYDIKYNKKVIIIGNEAKGVSKEIQDLADQRVKIPMLGKTESLNASVAASIMIYEYVREKYFEK